MCSSDGCCAGEWIQCSGVRDTHCAERIAGAVQSVAETRVQKVFFVNTVSERIGNASDDCTPDL